MYEQYAPDHIYKTTYTIYVHIRILYTLIPEYTHLYLVHYYPYTICYTT